jgi:perosamine synthetase
MSIQIFDARIPEARNAAAAVLASGQIGSGPKVAALEKAMEAVLPSYKGVTFSNMTVAIESALMLAGVGPGDEVLTLAFNCLSSNAAIQNCGARVVWVDLDLETGTMDVDDAKAQITDKTRAIVVYHIAGYPADTAALRAVCDEFGLILIEDANAAYGSRLTGGLPVGSLGDFTVFSFYANRQINGAEGAILMCRDAQAAELARRHRRFGIDLATFRDPRGEINPGADVPRIGIAGTLNHLNAAIALVSLETVDARLAKVKRNAAALAEGLTSVPSVRAVAPRAGSEPAYWVFMVLAEHQDKVSEHLSAKGIGNTKLHQPNHLYSGFNSTIRALPATQRFSASMVGLPVGWWLELSDVDQILAALKSV